MAAHQDMFSLRDDVAGSEFSDRVKDVFASLGSGQVKHDDTKDTVKECKPDFEQQQMERCRVKTRDSVKEDNDEEVLFKKPKLSNVRGCGGGGNIKQRNKVPGWKKNPSGYTKYSLADVPDVTNSSNTAAAFDFLNKLKKDREEVEEPADLNKKVVFKKRSKIAANLKDGEGEVPDDDNSANDVDTSKPSEKTKSSKKKSKKESRSMLSFNEDEEYGE